VIAHRKCLSEPIELHNAGEDTPDGTTGTVEAAAPLTTEMEPADSVAESESSFVTRIRERYAAVRALHAQGMAIPKTCPTRTVCGSRRSWLAVPNWRPPVGTSAGSLA